jgi:hypothetical protein
MKRRFVRIMQFTILIGGLWAAKSPAFGFCKDCLDCPDNQPNCCTWGPGGQNSCCYSEDQRCDNQNGCVDF